MKTSSGDRKGNEERGQSEHQPDIGDIASHHVAHGQFRRPLKRRLQAHRQFWGGRAESHDGGPDDKRADFVRVGDAKASADQQDSPEIEKSQSGQDQKYIKVHVDGWVEGD